MAMRFLSLGFPLPGPRVDNYSFTTAPSFFDYDAVVVDPAALSRLVETLVDGEESYHTHFEEPVANGLTTPEQVGLADVLRRRQDEAARLLADGKIIVCFAYPDVAHPRVAGFTGCDRYYWLPAPPGFQYREPDLVPAEGTEAEATDAVHPFAPFIAEIHRHVGYRACFNDAAPNFSRFGRVIARSRGGAAVGVELKAGGGTIVFLPTLHRPPAGEPRYRLSETLQQCIADLAGRAMDEAEPAWAAEIDLPGLAERRQALAAADATQRQSLAALEQAEAQVQERERFEGLLWQAGSLGLGRLVREAFGLLGFAVPADDDTPLTARMGARTLLVEAAGSDGAVGMNAHHRLRARLEEAIAATSEPPAGALVVNGYRLRRPDDRPRQYDDALAVAATSMRYCLLTSADLFDAVRASLAGDESAVADFRERLFHTEGPLPARQAAASNP